MGNSRFTELINLYLLDRITHQEGAELAVLLQSPANQAEFDRLIHEQLEQRQFDLEEPSPAVYGRIHDYLGTHVDLQRTGRTGDGRVAPMHRVHFIRRSFWRYAAAVLVVAAGVYFLYQQARTPVLLSQEKRFRNDLQPGSRRATMTLADGKRIVMTDTMAVKGFNKEIRISTGKGETYSLVLPDGSTVWLNASSLLHCPAGFGKGERSVELTGEAYFEVRHDKEHPFSVRLPDGSLVKDIGTRFNIHAYADEKTVRTTVLEGEVSVETKGKELSVTPGEQAEYSSKEDVSVSKAVNVQNTVAWKEEEFMLDATPIQDIMKQVGRWYGAEVVYQDHMEEDTTAFFGTLKRNIPVSQLLKTLEATGHVHFIIEGKKIIVMK